MCNPGNPTGAGAGKRVDKGRRMCLGPRATSGAMSANRVCREWTGPRRRVVAFISELAWRGRGGRQFSLLVEGVAGGGS